MLALAEIRADTCGGCGGALSETTAPEAENQYVVLPPHRCHRCTALHQVQQDSSSPDKTKYPQALMWSVVRRVQSAGSSRARG